MSYNFMYTSNYMFAFFFFFMYTSNYMFDFFFFFFFWGEGGAGHGKMSLNSIYTANYMIFRGASLENVLKILCTHQITCFLWGRVTGKM